jgi:hypothetical protein
MGQLARRKIMKHSKFFIPTKHEIVNLKIGSLAPDFNGKMKEVTEITVKEKDVNGKWFVCYYTKFGNLGSVSNSMKEGKLDRNLPLCNEFTSSELDNIEAKMNAEFALPF